MILPSVALVLALVGLGTPQRADLPSDGLIRLQRTSCFGPCPVYSVTIDATGAVLYEGEKHVRALGRHTGNIAPSTVARLLATIKRIRFFDLRDAYRYIEHPDGTRTMIDDLATTIITVTVNGQTKRVESYFGAPASVAALQRQIDEAAGTKRWIFVDEATLTGLLRSGWLASSDEGAKLLQEAIRRDDVNVTRLLLEAGAGLDGSRENPWPVIGAARSAAMVHLLVKAGADVNQRPVGLDIARTPLMIASDKDAPVAEAILKAGARLEDLDGGRTALWYAACRGNWRVATVLLNGGANPRGGIDMPAVECARQGRQDEVVRRSRPPIFPDADAGMPTVEDFDRIIVLLERAQTQRKR